MGNTPSSVPSNGQVSQVRFPVDCTNTVTGNVLSQDFTFSATAPLAAGSYYLSNVQASLPYPGTILGGRLTVNLAFSNAQPSTLQASDTTFAGNTLVIPGQDISDLGPIQHGPLTIGPVTTSGDVSRYSVSGLSYTVIDSQNIQSNYTCNVRANIVGSVTNDGTTQPALPAGDVPSAPSGSKATTANLPLSCADVPYGLQMTAISPLQPSELFQLTNFIFFFKVPASEVNRIKSIVGRDQVQIGVYVNKDQVPGSLAGLGFNLTNASPALYDLVTDGYTPSVKSDVPTSVQANYKTAGGDLNLAFPLVGNLALNPWQITSGGIFSARPLGINGLLTDFTYNVQEQVACSVSPAVELFAGPIP